MKKVFIVTAIMATMLLFGLGTQAMAHDAILFPYFSSGGGELTAIQIINTAAIITPSADGNNLKFVYIYNSGTEICQHADKPGKVTQNDILLYEVTGASPAGKGMLLPGDTTSAAPHLISSPATGYLMVVQDPDVFGHGIEGSIRGQAFVINVTNGTVFAYNAVNDPETGGGGGIDFAYDVDDQVLMSFLPETYATTVYFIFPVNQQQIYAVASGCSKRNINFEDDDLSYGVLWNAKLKTGDYFGGILNNNEFPVSGTTTVSVGCQTTLSDCNSCDPVQCISSAPKGTAANFKFTLAQLMTGEQYAEVKGTGGFFDGAFQNKIAGGYIQKVYTSSLFGGRSIQHHLFEPYFYGDIDSYTK